MLARVAVSSEGSKEGSFSKFKGMAIGTTLSFAGCCTEGCSFLLAVGRSGDGGGGLPSVSWHVGLLSTSGGSRLSAERQRARETEQGGSRAILVTSSWKGSPITVTITRSVAMSQ